MSFILLGILNSQAAGGGAASAMELLETVTVTDSSTQTITFSSIPSGYKDLEIRGVVKGSRTASTNDVLSVKLNGDTGANYSWHWFYTTGSTPSTGNYSARTYGRIDNIVASGSSNTLNWSPLVMNINDYANSSKGKAMRWTTGTNYVNSSGQVYYGSNGWFQNTAVTSVSFDLALTGDYFVAGTRLSIYGVKEV